MEEVAPGKYEGTWTVPSATELQGATIEVKIADNAGNQTTAEAAGKLFVSQNINRSSSKRQPLLNSHRNQQKRLGEIRYSRSSTRR